MENKNCYKCGKLGSVTVANVKNPYQLFRICLACLSGGTKVGTMVNGKAVLDKK